MIYITFFKKRLEQRKACLSHLGKDRKPTISQAYDGSDRLKNAVLKSTGSRQEKLIKMGTEIWAKQKIAEREYAESVELYGDDEQDAYDPEDER